MKFLYYFTLLITILSSYNEKEVQNKIEINYTAQTRGFNYVLHLKNNNLKINNNNNVKEVKLNSIQYYKIDSLLNCINFNEIESNILANELAVDRAIKGVFSLKLKEKKYTFEFNHQNLPNTIKNIFNQLEEFLK